MADFTLEQKVYCKIRSKLAFYATDIHADLQKVYEENAIQYGVVAKLIRRFKDWRKSVEDDERTRRPVAATSEKEIDIIKELIEADARYTVEELTQISGISSSSVYRILIVRLWLKKVCARCISLY